VLALTLTHSPIPSLLSSIDLHGVQWRRHTRSDDRAEKLWLWPDFYYSVSPCIL